MSGTAVRDADLAKFTCKLRGIPPPSVHWYYRNQEIVGSDEVYELYHEGEIASLCLPEVLPEDEGEYSCTIKNEMGETSCSAFLKVQGMNKHVECTFHKLEQRLNIRQKLLSFSSEVDNQGDQFLCLYILQRNE